VGIGTGAADQGGSKTDAKPTAAEPRPTMTVTATVTAPAEEPEPAPTVTATKTVKVKVTKTVTARPAAGGDSASDDGSDSSGTDVYYANCTEARAAGAAPIHRGEPGYASHLDRDGDGVGCDS
jgi:hypothetical protein